MDMAVKFTSEVIQQRTMSINSILLIVHCLCLDDSSSNGSRDIQQRSRRMWHFRQFFELQVVNDVISGMVDQDGRIVACSNFGDSRLKPSEVSFSAVFRTPMTSDWKYLVTSCPVHL